MTLKVLSWSCSVNVSIKSTKFPILETKLNRINTSFPVEVLWYVFKGLQENDRFFKIFLCIVLEKLTYSFQSFTDVIAEWFGDGYK